MDQSNSATAQQKIIGIVVLILIVVSFRYVIQRLSKVKLHRAMSKSKKKSKELDTHEPFSNDLKSVLPIGAAGHVGIGLGAYIFGLVVSQLAVIFFFVYAGATDSTTRNAYFDKPLFNFFAYLVFAGAQLLIIWTAYHKSKISIKKAGYRRPKLSLVVDVLAAFGVYTVMSVVANRLFAFLFTSVDLNQAQVTGFESAKNLSLVLPMISFVIIAPMFEELFFRGFLYRGLRNNFGIVASAIITSLLFGLVHRQWNLAIDTFALSISLIYVFEITGNLWAAVALHALKNAISFVVLYLK
jgi:membrane protease YdiL (CAAX protease family)